MGLSSAVKIRRYRVMKTISRFQLMIIICIALTTASVSANTYGGYCTNIATVPSGYPWPSCGLGPVTATADCYNGQPMVDLTWPQFVASTYDPDYFYFLMGTPSAGSYPVTPMQWINDWPPYSHSPAYVRARVATSVNLIPCGGFSNPMDVVFVGGVADGPDICMDSVPVTLGSCGPCTSPNVGCFNGQVCNTGTGACEPCTDSDQCGAGQACNAGACGPRCSSNADCSSGKICDVNTGECGACTADYQCGTGQVCNAGACVPACSSNADCGNGQVCNGEACVPSCSQSSDCSNGQACIAGGCGPCTDNAQCSAGQECMEGACISTCTSFEDCANGQVCDEGLCGPCTDSSQCPSGRVCKSGACGACTADNQCATGQFCLSGVCTTPPSCSENRDCWGYGRWWFCRQDNVCGPCGSVFDCPPAYDLCMNGHCSIFIPTSIVVTAHSPVFIAVTDPAGNFISKDVNEIPGAAYVGWNTPWDTDVEGVITIPDPLPGVYRVSVSPKLGAPSDATYALTMTRDDVTLNLATDAPVGLIPSTPYGVQVPESGPITTVTPCTTPADCTGGQVCTEGACGPCTSDTDCAAGQVCLSGACTTPPPETDTTPPQTTIDLTGIAGNNGWFTSDVTVSLSSTDNPGGSGVASTEYSLDGTTWIPYTGPFTISTEGTTMVSFYSTDVAGNVEATEQQAVSIDRSLPQITITSPADGARFGLNDPITADYSAVDSISGIDVVTGTVPDGDAVNTAAPGSYSFYVTATDKAGNTATRWSFFTVYIPAKVTIYPRVINLAGTGSFIAFGEMPRGYRATDIVKTSVQCEGASAKRVITTRVIPQLLGAVFRSSELEGVQPGDKVVLTVSWNLFSNDRTYEFQGSDTVRVIGKEGVATGEIQNWMALPDADLFAKYRAGS